ncbi:electron transport complex subunit RsxC [Thalassotalea agarivorans]|uniref:Ion-translocating oxidoreductase complex subunit C n=1 Tax=Thalassotalea agarivorans TaxID=349064 RepID=A0A1H9ZVD3_THASX|nr:electron transport complex subunit RsxC [Thalassotalea agarivorans]SES85695.1 electron transport complex protein RnfC [Thalassotalea agarivorans]
MENILARLDKKHYWQFHGGVHPPEQKFLTENKPIRQLPLPDKLIIPLQQHIGSAGKLLVQVGDKVLKGQPLTQSGNPMQVPVHAPTSGIVSAIEKHTIAHPSAMKELCLILTPDGQDKWRPREACNDPSQLDKQTVLNKIANAGIAGMGGAGFPTLIKVNTSAEVDFLIINAAECEPYITADDLLIQEQASEILEGIKILDGLLSPKQILIGIEDNKPKAIAILQKLCEQHSNIRVCVIPSLYPSGGEKQLIKILTGKEVPSGTLPSQIGIVMHNVGTCQAIADAILHDTPLISRVVTVTGQALDKPQNMRALLGTPVSFLLEQAAYNNDGRRHIIMGGPMMGFSLPSADVPVVKITNCILAPSPDELNLDQQEQECIRCGQCAEVCPAVLLPQEMQWSAKAQDYDQLRKLNLFDCIECGACAYVCPSQIPLVHYYRVAKAEIRQLDFAEVKAEKAKARFEARKARLERDKLAREEKHRLAAEARKARMNAGTEEGNKEKSAVAAALARVKAKKAEQTTETNSDTSPVAAAVARAKAKKAAQAATQEQPKSADKSSAVAAAVARAKAKKAAQAEQQGNDTETQDTQLEQVAEKPKAKAVSAAVAKAKAKKVAKEAEAASATNAAEDKTPTDATAKKKSAAVSAAVAKAKAKKAALSDKTTTESDKTSETKKKTTKAVASAVAKAKAKKAEKQKADGESVDKKAPAKSTSAKKTTKKATTRKTTASKAKKTSKVAETATPSAAEKKAKVSAAVAKAKAKQKAAQIDLPLDEAAENNADAKKQRIAAAVAKAKAKKEQREAE